MIKVQALALFSVWCLDGFSSGYFSWAALILKRFMLTFDIDKGIDTVE